MRDFDAFLQAPVTCPACKQQFALYVDELPSQDMTGPSTLLRCDCTGCSKTVDFAGGAFTHITDPKDLPDDAVHADIIEP